MEIRGKVAVITGGSRGIGRATAIALAQKGAHIAIIYRSSEEKAKALVQEISKTYKVKAKAYECDVSNFNKVKETVLQIEVDFGAINILVNNAGILIKEPFLETKEETWNKTIDVNLKGVFNTCRFVIPVMLKNNSGKIVNTSKCINFCGQIVPHPLISISPGGRSSTTRFFSMATIKSRTMGTIYSLPPCRTIKRSWAPAAMI